MTQIALILFNSSTLPNWEAGSVWQAPFQPREFMLFMNKLLKHAHPQAWLFWDARLGDPDPKTIQAVLNQPDDMWHAGLSLGTNGLPGLIDFVAPNWMLNCDPEGAGASWRVSPRACLVRDDVFRQIEFIDENFETLHGAFLEWGHRCIQQGVFCRYEPALISLAWKVDLMIRLPLYDEFRFVESRYGRRWRVWSQMRALVSGYANIVQIVKASYLLKSVSTQNKRQAIFKHKAQKSLPEPLQAKVTVLIPTLDRYSYLVKVLGQLRNQTIRPLEIIVVDQTPSAERQSDIYTQFQDLPLSVIFQDHAGQCSSRNAGLLVSRGDYILFIDDDDEIASDLIERHLIHIETEYADASCGVADEIGAGDLPQAFTMQRIADVFPTNNSLLRRDALMRSGLFDLAFDHGARADADLGMRLYLSGARIILNPDVSVLHHHAPRGGLRSHKARVITYASSRQSMFQRSLPSATEIYLSQRYFSAPQTREIFWINGFASFSLHHSSLLRRFLKVMVSIFLLPDTLTKMIHAQQLARTLSKEYPNIPSLLIKSNKE